MGKGSIFEKVGETKSKRGRTGEKAVGGRLNAANGM